MEQAAIGGRMRDRARRREGCHCAVVRWEQGVMRTTQGVLLCQPWELGHDYGLVVAAAQGRKEIDYDYMGLNIGGERYRVSY